MATKKAKSAASEVVVTKSNHLVEACYRLDLVELRVIALAIHIGRTNDLLCDGPDRDLCAPIRIEASRFTHHFPMGEHVVYQQIRDAVKKLVRKPLSAIEPINGVPCPVDIPWFSKATYIAQDAAIEVKFNSEVLPYISRLENEFTEYRIEKIGRLTSAHAVRLYEMLAQYLSLGKRDIDVDWLKKTLMIEKEYPDIYDLKKRVIDPSVKQINELTDLDVSYVQRKRGRVVSSFFFTIQMKDADKPKRRARPIDEAMIAAAARPGETHDDAYHRIRAERAAAKKKTPRKAPVPLEEAPVQMEFTEVEPARRPPPPEVEAERKKVLALARAAARKTRG